MSKKDDLKNILHSTIDNLDYFIEEFSGSTIYVGEYDKNSTSYLLKSIDFVNEICEIEVRQGRGKVTASMKFDNNKVFTIYDSNDICFIPIDGKNGLLGGTSNCDFVFFNEHDFCFVELKLNATLTDEQTLLQQERAIRQNRKDAVEQLKNTIIYFDTQLSGNYSGLLLEAYIATPDIYPRENTAFQSIKIQFLEDTHIELFESREKRYAKQM